jgi:hypothetical protein
MLLIESSKFLIESPMFLIVTSKKQTSLKFNIEKLIRGSVMFDSHMIDNILDYV